MAPRPRQHKRTQLFHYPSVFTWAERVPNPGCSLKGLGAGVLELVHEADKNACRVVYALRIGTKTGSKTPKNVKSRIEARLKLARALEKGGAG
jgi:hypothetical protein